MPVHSQSIEDLVAEKNFEYYPTNDVTDLHNADYHTFGRVLKTYREHGVSTKPRQSSAGRPRSLTNQRLGSLPTILENTPTKTFDESQNTTASSVDSNSNTLYPHAITNGVIEPQRVAEIKTRAGDIQHKPHLPRSSIPPNIGGGHPQLPRSKASREQAAKRRKLAEEPNRNIASGTHLMEVRRGPV